MNKQDVVDQLLEGHGREPVVEEASCYASANIALCKYWGKRDRELNLPVTSSLSVSLGPLGTRTRLRVTDADADRIELNGEPVDAAAPFASRLTTFLDLIRKDRPMAFEVKTDNTIPTAAGLASSASGFAALVNALDQLFGWELDATSRSILARLGSGSASRSIFSGFVEWQAGSREDGMDSCAVPLPDTWPDFRIGLICLTEAEKEIGSRDAMNRTVETSALYRAWPDQVASDLTTIHTAIVQKDFDLLGTTAEANALAMHATALAARPSILYWTPETVATIRTVQSMRRDGLPVYLTMDAGPNVKVLYTAEAESSVSGVFPDMQAVAPFADRS